MKQRYYAHSGNETDHSDWQGLSEHLHCVANTAAEFAHVFGAQHVAYYAGLLHDLGKYSDAFAHRLEGGPRVDHSTAGAQEAYLRWCGVGKLMAYAIAGHHAGLANGINTGTKSTRSELAERLQRALPPLAEGWEEDLALVEKLCIPIVLQPRIKPLSFQLAFFTRMIFSCLVDADYLDTERFYAKLKHLDKPRGNYPSIAQLDAALDTHLIGVQQKKSSAPHVDTLRQRILHHAIDQASLPPGLFSFTVPTGGGKTLSSMSFALKHALAQQLRRVIYVIPYTSIIEQNAAVFRDAFGSLGEHAVLEHHSSYQQQGVQDKSTRDKLQLAAENWEPPVICTTAVQFFESLFADRPAQCRKLHNIAGSVIVLDEAQTLPRKLLIPTLEAIKELAHNYRCSIVLCTATQPALLAPNFQDGLENVREIAPNPTALYRDLQRVTVRHIGEQSDEQLAPRLIASEQVLMIVNNRRHARTLYDMLNTQATPGLFHLTTLMCAQHRREQLDAIRACLQRGDPCRVISTSLIEAGVDIDFPLVLRAEAGLDSIAQAAGRCNRSGHRSAHESLVLVFSTPQWSMPTELEACAAHMRTIFPKYQDDPLSLEAIEDYFREIYWHENSQLDFHHILEQLHARGDTLDFPFEKIAREYRLIESTMQTVIIPYNATADALIQSLRHATFVGRIANQLQPYLVQIPDDALTALRESGAVQNIAPEHFGGQFWALMSTDLYDEHCGLSWSDPFQLTAESYSL